MLRTFALTALLTCAIAAQASAATITQADGRLVFAAADGETNQLTMTMMDTGPVLVRDATATLTGCAPFSHPEWPELPDDLMCIGGAPKVTLGDGNDAVSVADAGTEMPIGTTEADGGEGNDTIRTGISDDVLRGGPGDDDLWAGEQGDDTLDGGPGADKLTALWGDDTILARDGDKDTIDCGDGVDTVTADRIDVLTGCETVDLEPLPTNTQPPPRPGDDTGPGAGTGGTSTATTRGTGPGNQISAYPDWSARDFTRPKLRVTAKGRTLTIRADEACKVTVKAGGKTFTRRLTARRAVKIRVPRRSKRVNVVARDAAGNIALATKYVR